MRLGQHRLVLTLGTVALVFGAYELQQPLGQPLEARERASHRALLAAYPDEARMRFRAGMRAAQESRLSEAMRDLRASFEAGFKEDEGLYATYIALLMSTEPDRERVLEVLSRWRRDYPVSQRRRSVEARLEQAGVL